MNIKFYDTNAILNNLEEVESEHIYISSITLEELENIKTSGRKDEDVKFHARKATRYFKENPENYTCIITQDKHYSLLEDFKLKDDNDNLIMAGAYLFQKENNIQVDFVTNDVCCYNIAKNIFKLNVITNEAKVDYYTGYIEITMDNIELAEWYQHKENKWSLLNNQYLVIKDENNEVIDRYKYLNGEFLNINVDKYIFSSYLGKFRPCDEYQLLALDSLQNNKLTMIKGKAGTGKSLISMSFLLHQLEKQKISKIIIFVNSPKVRGSSELGFYPGSKDEKLLQSQIGNFLISKLGDIMAVQMLISRGQLEILPMSDIRGYDTSNMNAGIYITESQNTSVDLMRLALQRIGEDCICIIDGDYTTQVDSVNFAGANNGMKRMSEVFRGEEIYGEIELKTIHRSKIAEIAERM